MRAADSVKALMAGSDPAADVAGDPGRRRQDLERILAEQADTAAPRRSTALLRRPRLLVPLGGLAVAASAALVFGLLPGSTAGTAYAATPPPLQYTAVETSLPAGQVLEGIAQHTAALSEPTGADTVLEWKDWSLFTRIDGETVSSRVVAEDHKAVVHTDGSGTLTSAFEGQGAKTEAYAPGLYREPMPTNPALLRESLRRSTPAIDAASGADQALRGVLRSQALDPAQRAAVLRLIAGLPELRYEGSVTDRAGRSGQAFSADSDGSGLPTRYTFIIEAATGRILGQEAMLTTRAGELNVPVPSVISYTAYLDAHKQ
ncbi:hypothetical protein [Kitasatospora phosalacinea]|uniref:hypothetical protein n=1 Tax=Kitasatospora phosalacinea TaxID=2065 RepID=UPI00068DCCAD|nr:hypothetical protein [Kitasatospora phosalacinea]